MRHRIHFSSRSVQLSWTQERRSNTEQNDICSVTEVALLRPLNATEPLQWRTTSSFLARTDHWISALQHLTSSAYIHSVHSWLSNGDIRHVINIDKGTMRAQNRNLSAGRSFKYCPEKAYSTIQRRLSLPCRRLETETCRWRSYRFVRCFRKSNAVGIRH